MISKDTLKDIPRPEWLPDWISPEAYPDHGENAAAWAWEFLRRNPEYQADFKHYMSVPAYYPEGGKTPKLVGRSPGDDSEMIYFHADPPAASPFETWGEYLQRTGIEPTGLETHLLQKWGLMVLNDPAWDEPVWFSTDDPLPPFVLEQASYGHIFREYVDIDRSIALHYERPGREVIFASWPEQDDGFMHVFAFDVRLPLDGQLAAVKAELEEARLQGDPNDLTDMLGEGEPEPIKPIKPIRPPSPRFGNMREYLRVFDAVWTVGWDRQAIADRIFGDKTSSEGAQTGSALKRVDRSIEQAMEYASGEYSTLLLWAGFPKKLKKTIKE